MKSQLKCILSALIIPTIFCFHPENALALISYNDGLTHNIDYVVNDSVYADYETPDMYTTVNVLTGGSINQPESSLVGYNQSIINVYGGTLRWLESHGPAQLNIYDGLMNLVSMSGTASIFGGSIAYFSSFVDGQTDIFGGSISYILPKDSSSVYISGGSIYVIYGISSSETYISGGEISGEFRVDDQSTTTLTGYNFMVDGVPFGYGELTSILGSSYIDEPMRQLTGTLASGEPINTAFYIGHDAQIVLIPVPGAILLGIIGLGCLNVLHKRVIF